MDQNISFQVVNDFARYFNSIVLEALPFVVLGVVIAGILEEFVPQEWIRGFFEYHDLAKGQPASRQWGLAGFAKSILRNRIAAIALGGLLGLVFPMCECGIIAIMRRLIRKGVPLSVCICYMLAGPIINVVVLLSTFVAFNPPSPDDYVLGGPVFVTALRAGMGFLVACLTAILVDLLHKKHGDSLVHPSLISPQNVLSTSAIEQKEKPAKSFGQRFRSISETALHDFVDIMTFLVLGATLATVGRMALNNEQVNQTARYLLEEGPPWISITLMMIIAIVFSLCSEADAFVAANFPRIWTPASKLAFLVLGPMFDLKLYAMFTRIFRQRLIWAIVTAVVIQVFVYTLAIHYLWPSHGYPSTILTQQR